MRLPRRYHRKYGGSSNWSPVCLETISQAKFEMEQVLLYGKKNEYLFDDETKSIVQFGYLPILIMIHTAAGNGFLISTWITSKVH